MKLERKLGLKRGPKGVSRARYGPILDILLTSTLFACVNLSLFCMIELHDHLISTNPWGLLRVLGFSLRGGHRVCVSRSRISII